MQVIYELFNISLFFSILQSQSLLQEFIDYVKVSLFGFSNIGNLNISLFT